MKLSKRVTYLAEAAFMWVVFGIMRLLPLDMASWLGGFIARKLAIYHKSTRIARQNLTRATLDLNDDKIDAIVTDMWDNMGRTMGEYAHLTSKKMQSRVNVIGRDILDKTIASDKAAIFVSGHFANWEVAPLSGYVCGLPLTLIYRPTNNPYTNRFIYNMRMQYAKGLYPKGRTGAMKVMKALKSGESIAMLVDQKMNEGIEIPFFGRGAMTAPATAQMALKYDVPIYLTRVVREKGANFSFIIEPLLYEKTGDREQDVINIMTLINEKFEAWIREYPAQWFWMHNRWPKD